MSSTHNLTSQATPADLPPNVITLTQTAQLEALYTIIRDKNTPRYVKCFDAISFSSSGPVRSSTLVTYHGDRGEFIFYSDRIIRLLVEEGTVDQPLKSRDPSVG